VQAFLQQYGQLIGFGILVLLLLRMSIDFGQAMGWIRAGIAWLRPTSTAQSPIDADDETEALRATKYLLKYFTRHHCPAGIAAAKTCGQHLLDHGDDPAPTPGAS